MLSKTEILGVPVSTVNMDVAVRAISGWVEGSEPNFVCVRDVHGLMLALDDPEMMRVQHDAGMVTPDGMPLVWLLRLRGYRGVGRVCGADLVDALCEASQGSNIRHFFYGGKPGVAERMVERLRKRYPQLEVAGTYSPPFHEMTPQEEKDLIALIKGSGAKIVWVGISTPKQEFWMRDHCGILPGATLIGVGAAFDFHAGVVRRAPRWMQKSGLEWLFRLGSEPHRLWRRYIFLAPKFVFLVLLSKLGLFRSQ